MNQPAPLLDGLLANLRAAVGDAHVRQDWEGLQPYMGDWAGRTYPQPAAIVFPSSTQQVSAVVRACAGQGVCIIPQGGNTGLVGGAAPTPHGPPAIVLNLKRLNRVVSIDRQAYVMIAQAGAVLQVLQEAAHSEGMLLPLSLGAEGSCMLGGNVSTNAGGTAVLRYGNMRDLTLGLEIVLPDGRIWDGLRSLRKDNTGYDLKQLFIGAEGTLGIVTAAAIKLFPAPRSVSTALVAVSSLHDVLATFRHIRQQLGDQVTAFEMMPRLGIEFACRHIDGASDPFGSAYPWYILLEVSGSSEQAVLDGAMETAFASLVGEGLMLDAVFASSGRQREQLWKLREGMVEAQKHEGGSSKHDISVPLASIPAFVEEVCMAAQATMPGIRPLMFGHVGDGNVHCNFSQPTGMDAKAFGSRESEIADIVYAAVYRHNGSISAEHGIGQRKALQLRHAKSDIEIELMHRIKQALDPQNLINPGKVLART